MAKNLDCANISTLEFLNYLKTAYQVHDSLEGYLTAGGMNDAVDWLKLKQNQIIKNEVNSSNSNSSGDNIKKNDLQDNYDAIKQKLDEVLSEGVLDSVIPHMVPSNTSTPITIKKSNSTIMTNDKSSNVSNTSITSTSTITTTTTATIKRRNSGIISSNIKTIDGNNNDNSDNNDTNMKSDSEIEIHVCDEVKNKKKDFICNKNLLVEKMGYFAQIAEGQRLEDMDISVHCDIGIFEWLLKWIKRDQLSEDDCPELTIQCVIPILVSASFLQIEQLLNDCLLYCHQNMNDILKQTTVNLSCLNDKIIQRLSSLYTNEEIENLKDRKDRIQSKLFIKLIQSLNELEPETIRGHYWSLSKIYRCLKCQQLINPIVSSNIPCIPSCMQLQCDGSIINLHIRDPSWNINDYILKLYKNLKVWRKVYWHLWSDAHFLYCTQCKRYFCVRELLWCRYHPDIPQYFALDSQKIPLPIGRYPCCGERAYRFQLLQHINNGCQYREHTTLIRDHRDTSILTMLEQYRKLIIEEPSQLIFPERLTRLISKETTMGDGTTTSKTKNGDGKLISKETFWWDGFQIIPPRPKLGLLTTFSNRNNDTKQSINYNDSGDEDEDISSNTNSTETITESSTSTNTTNTTNSSSNNSFSSSSSEEIEKNPKPIRKKKLIRKKKMNKLNGRLWQNNQSARSNQDGQRAYEENLMKEMVNFLQRRTTTASIVNSSQEISLLGQKQNRSKNVTPIGGVWVRLEAEWKESHNIPKIKVPTKKLK